MIAAGRLSTIDRERVRQASGLQLNWGLLAALGFCVLAWAVLAQLVGWLW